jgi:flavin reductase (DIM6/NTAB) family NADH-FMN oxidoreductase RutF
VLARYDRCAGFADPAMVVVTVAAGDERSGCLVGFHTQASIEPRRHLVYVSQPNHTHRLATVASHLGVHMLAEADHELARLFGEETGDAVDKFERCRWEAGPFGVPMLPDVPHRFVGAVVGRVPGGDHDGFLLEPVAAWSPREAPARPLRLQDVTDLDPGHPA